MTSFHTASQRVRIYKHPCSAMAGPIYGRYGAFLDCYVISWADPPKNRAAVERSGGAIAPVVLAKKKAPARDILIGEPETDELRAFGGSRSDKFNGVLINAMARTGWFPSGQTDEACSQQMFAAVAALRAFKPTDEIEGMLAAQTVTMHFGAMECFRRAMVPINRPKWRRSCGRTARTLPGA